MNSAATVEAQMMIRKPIATVFQAFIDPVVTTNFWFTKSSGKLETEETVTYGYEMYIAWSRVFRKEIILHVLIVTEWGDPVTKVYYHFKALTNDTTYVTIKNYGFNLSGDQLINAIKDQT